MPWGAVVGGAISAAGAYASRPDDPEMAPNTPTQTWQGYLAPQYFQNVANPQPFGGVAGLNNTQQVAGQGITNYAGRPSATQQAGQGAMMAAAGGNTNPMFGMDNPYTTKAIDATTSDMQRQFNRTTVPMLDAMNSRANTGFGTSSAVDQMRTDAYQGLNDQMGQVSNDMRMRDLTAQQHMGEGGAQRSLQAASMAPQFQGMDYNNFNAMMGWGNQQQAAQQAQMSGPQAYNQQQINNMQGAMGMGSSGPGFMPGQQQPNYLDAALGGAAGGMGLSNMFGNMRYRDPYALPTTTDGNMYQPGQYGDTWGSGGGGW